MTFKRLSLLLRWIVEWLVNPFPNNELDHNFFIIINYALALSLGFLVWIFAHVSILLVVTTGIVWLFTLTVTLFNVVKQLKRLWVSFKEYEANHQ